jgi:hypothetical protein
VNTDGLIYGRTLQTIIYSGRRDGRHNEEVAIILSKAAAKSMIEYHPVNARIIKERGITLLFIPSKICSKIIVNRIKTAVDKK